MTQKTISINPSLFTFGKTKQKTKKEKKEKKSLGIIAPNSLKNKFIEKVKQHQEKKNKETRKKDNKEEFGTEFQKSLQYLSSLIDKEKQNQPLFNVSNNLNKIESFQNENYLREQVNVDLPNNLKDSLNNTIPVVSSESFTSSTPTIAITSSIPTTPSISSTSRLSVNNNSNQTPLPYGNLKNGNKPTYRQWKLTRKRPFNKDKISNLPKNEQLNQREEKLNAVKSMFIRDENLSSQKNNEDDEINVSNVDINKDRKFAIKKSIKRKYVCGKNNKSRKVGVMIKSGETRAKIIREKRNLTRRSLHDIKNYLYKNGFLKIGSSAPKNILIDMYEACILTGKISNTNDKIYIHNYLNEK